MEARAIVRNVRMTPRKIKLICDLIRGKDAGEAMAIIMNTPKAACEPMEKLLKSAVANAENNHGMNTDKLRLASSFLFFIMPREKENRLQKYYHFYFWNEAIGEMRLVTSFVLSVWNVVS